MGRWKKGKVMGEMTMDAIAALQLSLAAAASTKRDKNVPGPGHCCVMDYGRCTFWPKCPCQV